MEIIIKLDHDELTNVKTVSTKDRELDQLIHTIKYRDDQLYHLRTRQDELLMNLQNKDDKIQDLKLENDRLKQREELYKKYLNMFDCHEITCVRCIQYHPGCDVPCNLALPKYRHKLINDLNEKLEAI